MDYMAMMIVPPTGSPGTIENTAPAAHDRKVDLQQLPWSMQILHLVSLEQRVRRRAGCLAVVIISRLAALGMRLHSYIAKEQLDALDNLCNSVGFVGVGNGYRIHGWWVYPSPVSHRFSRRRNPTLSGTQGYELARLMRYDDPIGP